MTVRQADDARQKARERQKKILRRFIDVYCREHCGGAKGGPLCPDCRDLWQYACSRLDKCPMDPKPKCKDCRVHCYQGAYRDTIRQVMKFSGMHFARRGRVDWLFRYFLSR